MLNKIIILNTNSGCGTSTISHFVLPYYFAKGKDTKEGFKLDKDQNLSIFELETTNKNRSSQYKESVVSYKYDTLENPNKTKELLEEIGFDDDSFAIFDIGGGRDALEAVRKLSIASVGLEDYLFVLPFTLSEDSFSAALDMYDRLKKEDGDIKALFVINKMPYRYDAGELPYKEFLDEDDISYEIEKSGLDIVKPLKEREVKFTYIPEMPESLSSGLFSREGCCIDMCREFINGKSGSEQRKELKKKIKSSSLPAEEQKAKYVAEMHKLSQNADMYRMLGYCKPFFEAIDELGGVSKNEKTKEKDMDNYARKTYTYTTDWIDLYGDFKKEMLADMASLKDEMTKISNEALSFIKEISLSASSAKEEFFKVLDEVKSFKEEASSSYEEVKKLISIQAEAREEALLSDEFVSKKVEQFKGFVDIFASLEGKTINIYNAEVQTIIDEMANIVGKDIKEGVADSLQKNDVIRKFKNISGISLKVEEQLDDTIKGLKELLLQCQKGNDDIYTSELILLKLMSVLRFLDRLSDKDRERIINSDFVVHEDVAKRIESFLKHNDSSQTACVEASKPLVAGIGVNENKIKVIESDISKIDQRLFSLENTVEKKFDEIISLLSKDAEKKPAPSKNKTTRKPTVAKKEKAVKKVTTKKEAGELARELMNKMFPSFESDGKEE